MANILSAMLLYRIFCKGCQHVFYRRIKSQIKPECPNCHADSQIEYYEKGHTEFPDVAKDYKNYGEKEKA